MHNKLLQLVKFCEVILQAKMCEQCYFFDIRFYWKASSVVQDNIFSLLFSAFQCFLTFQKKVFQMFVFPACYTCIYIHTFVRYLKLLFSDMLASQKTHKHTSGLRLIDILIVSSCYIVIHLSLIHI